MKTWMKVLGAAIIVSIAAAVTVVTLVTQYDYNQLKPTIAKLAKDATGRDLVINGDLRLAVSLSPTLTVSDVTFANAPWGQGSDMATLKQLSAKVDLLALLQGRVDIDYLLVDGLTAVLETDGKGRANWEFETLAKPQGEQSAGGLVLIPSARDVRLTNADITYIDGATGKRLHLVLDRAGIVSDSFTAPMYGTLVATYQGVAFEAQLDMGSLAQLVGTSGDAFPAKMSIEAPGVDVSIDAAVEQPQAGMTVTAKVNVNVSDGRTLSQLAGAELPNLGGLAASLTIAGGGTQYAFKAINANMRGSDIGGELAFDLGAKRPSVSGRLASKVVNLDTALDLKAEQPATAQGAPTIATSKPTGEAPKLFSTEPLAFDLLKQVDANVTVLASRVIARGVNVDALKTTVLLQNGLLNVKPLTFSIDTGEIEGTMRLNAAASTPTINATGAVRALDVGKILQALGMGDVVTLLVHGNADLTAKGDSLHAIMAGLGGNVRMSAQDGRINDDNFSNLTTSLGNALPWARRADGNVITCMIADWPIAGGVATARTVVMDTPGFSVALTGNVDLGGELLHLTVIPKAKTASLASFAVPVRLKGALSMPYMDVDPKDLVVGTVGNIFKAPANVLGDIFGLNGGASGGASGNPCLQGASGGKTTPQPAQPPLQPGQSSGDPVKDMNRAIDGIKGLFGQ